MGLSFRVADNRDVAIARQIIYPTLKEYGLDPEPTVTDADVEDIERHYGKPGSYFCIAEYDGLPVGTGGLRQISDKRCELRKMYLLTEFRGKGIGKQLLIHLVTRAKDMGYREITLETASVLREAIRLYERFGFVTLANAELPARCDQAMIFRLS